MVNGHGHGKLSTSRGMQRVWTSVYLMSPCGKKNHLEKVCRSVANAGVKAVHHDQIENKSLNTFCSISCDMLGDQLDALEHLRQPIPGRSIHLCHSRTSIFK